MKYSHLLIGAFYRSVFFDHVIIDPTQPPVDFTVVDGEETFPLGLLNNTQPTGFTAGTGGTDAVNKQYLLNFASPKFTQPDSSITDNGINGNNLIVPIRSAPKTLACTVIMPDIAPSHPDWDKTWGDLQKLAFRKVRILVLHRGFAFFGYISDAAGLFFSENFEPEVPFLFNIEYFYVPLVTGGNKLYQLLSYV